MIEQVMIFSLGFLIAALFALAIAPAFWRRAIRLSKRKLEMQLPLSAGEIRAARDLIRAEAALERRRLEQKAEALEEARANDRIELGRRAMLIARRDADLAALAGRSEAQGAELDALRRDLAQASAELAATATALDDTSHRCEQTDAALLESRQNLTVLHVLARNHRVAFAALERDLMRESEKLVVETVRIARLSDELVSLRRERDAALGGQRASVARIGHLEEALAEARGREIEFHRQGEVLAAEAGARERGLLAEIDRLRAENTTSLEARGPVPPLAESEDNAILRQSIIEIGAAIIRMSQGSSSPARAGASGNDESADELRRLVFAKADGSTAAE